MEQQHAVRILHALANGIHPVTGEVFAADSPYQHPDTVRALFEAMRVMAAGARTPAPDDAPASPAVPVNPFVRWTPDEEERLAIAFDSGQTSAALAKLHNRSRAAIEARLLKLGKIDASELTVKLRYPAKSASGSSAHTTS